MKKLIFVLVLFICGCETTTEQPCKFVINEQLQYVEVCR